MVLTDFLKGIADAIRYAEDSTAEISAQNFETRIRALKGVQPIPPTPIRPVIPQTGTWQLKTTTDKKYVILGTDDDNVGNAKFFRLLRTYGFPYTMNVEAENVSKMIGSDVDENIFSEADAPSVFPNSVSVTELGRYLYESGLGEVSQHGSSGKVLWDSTKLVGNLLNTMYDFYINAGGTKTKEEFANACKALKSSSDIAQGATYVAESRNAIENAMGFFVDTVGIWGGNPTFDIDGISVSEKNLVSSAYPWRADNYTAVGSRLSIGNNTDTYNICRESGGTSAILSTIADTLNVGKAIEFFWHMPFTDESPSAFREVFSELKALVDSGIVEVVTRKQYAELGEYVTNPIVRLNSTRSSLNIYVGEEDKKSEYTVTVTYEDGTTEEVTEEAIIKLADTSEEKVCIVPIYYRGFENSISLSVVEQGGGTRSIDLFGTWKCHTNENNGSFSIVDTYEAEWGSSQFISYNKNKTYTVSFNGTSTNNNAYPSITKVYCYDATQNYLGLVSITGILGKVENAELPNLAETYSNVAYFRVHGKVNKSYGEAQATNWSCIEA